MPIPDEYGCVRKLANTTVDETNALADKLIAIPTLPKDVLVTLQKAQKAMDPFTDNICGLDAVKIYNGTGVLLEIEACRYYYARQYLDILKGVEKTKPQ